MPTAMPKRQNTERSKTMKGLFFNSLPDDTNPTGYDRPFNADDISDFLSACWDTGVCKTDTVNGVPQGLKVSAIGGMEVSVNVGRCAIKGKVGVNIAAEKFTISPNGTNEKRYDYIVARYDNNVSKRDIWLELITGKNVVPSELDLVQNSGKEKMYDLMLAYIIVEPNATEITQSDIADIRGNKTFCPWFTPVKGYEEYYDAVMQTHESTVTLAEITNTVITDLASSLYNERYSIIEVYTNGIREPESAFNASVNGGHIVITFTAQKAVGSKITVSLGNFLDGEGMTTALAQYTQLLQDVADLKTGREYNYICNGVNDNILISNIVKEFYSVNDYKSLKLNIIGDIGMRAPAVGTGATATPYGWFDFTKPVETNRIATLDFTACNVINPTILDGRYNVIFTGDTINIIGANVIASNTASETVIRVFNAAAGKINAEKCRFWLTGYRDGMIAQSGTFTNCRASVANAVNNSYCFLPSAYGLLRVNGGEYYAYTGDANRQSAIVGQSSANTVSILYGVSAPTIARAGFYQTNSILQWTGGGVLSCTDLISALPLTVVSGISNIRGTIAISKPNLM